MGISQTYINIIEYPAIDATINFIKKFKLSKSYCETSKIENTPNKIYQERMKEKGLENLLKQFTKIK